MNKIVFRILIVLLAIVGLFLFLREINWSKIFGIDQATNKLEQELGDQIWESMKSTETVDKDTMMLEVLDTIVNRLCENNQIPQNQIKLHLIENATANAFAMPGDYLIVHTGLFTNGCKSADQIAGVIAHELAHIQKDHVSRKITTQIGITALTTLVGGNAEAVKEAIRFFTSNAYDRSLEEEADLLAVTYMDKSNLDPKALAETMDIFSQKSGNPELEENLSWFSTHPASKERAEYIRKEADKIQGKKYQKLQISQEYKEHFGW
jgi:beta-barrel assembly-enhancing protease